MIRRAALLFSLLLAHCAGGTIPTNVPPMREGSAVIRVLVPAKTAASRQGQYISPATSNLIIDVQQGGSSMSGFPITVPVTQNSPGCSTSAGATVCTRSLDLPVGSYNGSVTAEDALGTVLSANQGLSFSIHNATANVIPLTLYGVPASMSIVPVSVTTTGTMQSGFQLLGLGTHTFRIDARDADGNVIVGPGTPSYTVSTAGTLPLTVATPAPSSNEFTVSPPSAWSNGASNLTVDAVDASGACSVSGCEATSNVTMGELVAVLGNTGLTLFSTVTSGALGSPLGVGQSPSALAYDASGDIFVANTGSNSIDLDRADYSGGQTTITAGVSAPVALAVDASGDLFVANASSVTEYAPPYTGTPLATITNGINNPRALALSQTGTLFVANDGNNTVSVYAPPYTAAPNVISNGIGLPSAIAVDASNDAFVANLSANTVSEYLPPYTASPVTISSGIAHPAALALSSSGSLFVSNATPSVTEFTPPFTGSATAVLTNGITNGASGYGPSALAFDRYDDLVVVDASAVQLYQSPYTGAPVTIDAGSGLISAAVIP